MRYYQLIQNAEKQLELAPVVKQIFMQDEVTDNFFSQEFINRLHVFESSANTEVEGFFCRGTLLLLVLLKGKAEFIFDDVSLCKLDEINSPKLFSLIEYLQDQTITIRCEPGTEILTAVLHASSSKNADEDANSIDLSQNIQYMRFLKKELINSFSQNFKVPLMMIDANLSQLQGVVEKHEIYKQCDGLIQNINTQIKIIEDRITKNITRSQLAEEIDSLRPIPMNVEEFLMDFLKETGNVADEAGNISNVELVNDVKEVNFLVDVSKLKAAMKEIISFFMQNQIDQYPHQWIAKHNKQRDQIEFILYITYNKDIKPEIFDDNSNATSVSVQDNLLLVHDIVTMHRGNVQILEKNDTTKIKIIIPQNLWRLKIKNLAFFILDKDPDSLHKVQKLCNENYTGIQFYIYDNWQDLINDFYEHKPELIFICPDFDYDGMSGDLILQRAQKIAKDQAMIIVLSQYPWEQKEKQLKLGPGIFNWVQRPAKEFELNKNISNVLEFINKYSTLSHTYKDVKMSSERDGLTGLYNRGYFDLYIQSLYKEAIDLNNTFSIIMTDIDNFKNYNDTNGHQLGDKTLKKFSRIMSDCLRLSDTVARYGGEEFVIVLPYTTKENALKIAEKVRKSVQDEPFVNEVAQPLKQVTASFGVANYPADAKNVKDLIKFGDENLYKAKKNGRNMIY
mgnify:CR=1 FL=1